MYSNIEIDIRIFEKVVMYTEYSLEKKDWPPWRYKHRYWPSPSFTHDLYFLLTRIHVLLFNSRFCFNYGTYNDWKLTKFIFHHYNDKTDVWIIWIAFVFIEFEYKNALFSYIIGSLQVYLYRQNKVRIYSNSYFIPMSNIRIPFPVEYRTLFKTSLLSRSLQ